MQTIGYSQAATRIGSATSPFTVFKGAKGFILLFSDTVAASVYKKVGIPGFKFIGDLKGEPGKVTLRDAL